MHCFSKCYHKRLENWKKELLCADVRQANLERWLFIHVAGVLFAEKPGELVILKKDLFGLNPEISLKTVLSFSRVWETEYRLLDDAGQSLKIIIYRSASVNKRLAAASKKILHCVLKYPFGLDSNLFFTEIASRWRASGLIPHEIGIALGYPMKDIWGFMGISSDPCSGTCGWRIFGDPEPSIKMKARYDQARLLASQYLEAA